jgi:hypothetical protein
MAFSKLLGAASVCTALELLGLAVVIAVGVPKLGSINYLATAPAGASGVMSAGALVFFAYGHYHVTVHARVRWTDGDCDGSKSVRRWSGDLLDSNPTLQRFFLTKAARRACASFGSPIMGDSVTQCRTRAD